MLDEAVLNKATRPPMLDEAFKIETVKDKAKTGNAFNLRSIWASFNLAEMPKS